MVKIAGLGGLMDKASFFGAGFSGSVGEETANLGCIGANPVSDNCRRRSSEADSGGEGRAAIFLALMAVKVATLSGLPVS